MDLHLPRVNGLQSKRQDGIHAQFSAFNHSKATFVKQVVCARELDQQGKQFQSY